MVVRPITHADASQWEHLRCALWPDGASDHSLEIGLFFQGKLCEPQSVFVAEEDGGLIGFVELSIRNDIVGLIGKRTGYVEGLYVVPKRRHIGVARQLLRASRKWAASNQCEAFASDRAERIVIDQRFPLLPDSKS